jgi:predicted ester cyclase
VVTTEELIRKEVDAVNGRDFEILREVFSSDFQFTGPGSPVSEGHEAFVQLNETFLTAFPDSKLTIHRIIAGPDGGARESRFTATHTGELQTSNGVIPPTGRQVSIDYVVIYEASGDALTSWHVYYDQVELMTQLGVMPPWPLLERNR